MPALNKKTTMMLSLCVALAANTQAMAYDNPNDTLDGSLELYDDNRFKNSSESLEKLVKSRSFRKLDSMEKSLALTYLIDSKLQQGKARSAMPYATTLLKVSKSGFGELSEEHVDAYYMKAKAQYFMGDERDSARSVESMVNLLDRMGSDYRKAVSNARRLASRVRSNEWKKEDLGKDLSDFYTHCESIEEGMKISVASSSMSDFLRVGSGYKPKGRVKRDFENTYIKHARENSSDRANRLIFIPDTDHLDHWCVVYPGQRGVVDRAVTSPPKK